MEREIVERCTDLLRVLIHLCLYRSLVCEAEIQPYTEFQRVVRSRTLSWMEDFFIQWIENGIEEPNLTVNAIAFDALLFYFRKFKGKYTWILRLFAVIPVSLFFIIYIPKVFIWLLQ